MGGLFSKKRTYWVPANKQLQNKVSLDPVAYKEREDFTGWQIQNDPTLQKLTQKFILCETLLELNLSFNGLGDDECAYLGQLIQQSKSLKRLILINNFIHAEGAQKLANGLNPTGGQDPILQELNLRNNDCGPEGAIALANKLSTNMNLRKLNLYWNNIRNKGLEAICANLRPGLGVSYVVVRRTHFPLLAPVHSHCEHRDSCESEVGCIAHAAKSIPALLAACPSLAPVLRTV